MDSARRLVGVHRANVSCTQVAAHAFGFMPGLCPAKRCPNGQEQRHAGRCQNRTRQHCGDPIRPHRPEWDEDDRLRFRPLDAAPDLVLEARRQAGRRLPIFQQSAKSLVFMSWWVGIHTDETRVARRHAVAAANAGRSVVVIIVRLFVGDSVPPSVVSLITSRCGQSLERNWFVKEKRSMPHSLKQR